MSTRHLLGLLAFVIVAVPAQAADLIAHPQIALETTEGRIVLELDTKRAPLTVERIVELTRKGYYDGLIFHRVKRGFVIQTGAYNLKLQSSEKNENLPNESGNGLSNRRGTVAMARTPAPHSAGAQFYINVADNEGLDPRRDNWGYALFGKVIEGMDVVDTISNLPTGPQAGLQDVPTLPVVIDKATVLTD
ncbi:MAG: peptidylprolyl isomerase [Pseudomonadota bacterium]